MTITPRERLRSARPKPAQSIPDHLRARVLDDLPDDTPAVRRRRRRRRRPTLPAAILGLLCCGGVAVAAVAIVPADTREQSRVLATQPADDHGGAGIADGPLRRELERLRAITPYPPGVRDTFPEAALQGVTTGSVRAVVEQRENCLWQRYWVSTAQAGDREGAQAAATILRQSADWPTFKTPYGEGHQMALDIAAQAQRGDLAAFRERMQRGCRAVFQSVS